MIRDLDSLVHQQIEQDPIYPCDNRARANRIVALTQALEEACSLGLLSKEQEATVRHLLTCLLVECIRFDEGLDEDGEIVLTESKEDTCETNF